MAATRRPRAAPRVATAKTADRTLDVFELFASEQRPLNLSEISALLGIPLSSAHALIKTLQARGYLYDVGRRQGYFPTTRMQDITQAIARAVRFSSGGLPCLKALGVRLDHRGLVQVSMNLTNYERTPLSAAFARVVEEARGYGVEVVDSEIIGLVPERALEGTTAEELRLTRPPLLLPTA